MRGLVVGEITGRVAAEVSTDDLHLVASGDTQNIAAFADTDGNLSRPVYAPNDNRLSYLESKIDRCKQPTRAIVGVIFKHRGVYCPALARSVVQHRGLLERFLAETGTKAS